MVNKLPKNVTLSSDILSDSVLDGMMDDIDNYLSDTYGFCVNTYDLTIELKARDIKWDTSE